MEYITIEEQTYLVNTVDEIQIARKAVTEAGLKYADVYVGEPDGIGDSYKAGFKIWPLEVA